MVLVVIINKSWGCYSPIDLMIGQMMDDDDDDDDG